MKTKVVAPAFGGTVAALLLSRCFAPSPKIDGLGQNSGVPARPLASPSPAASFSQRLQELANLVASGAISDREYIERHRRIISVARTVVR
jgi:hypothetical protein